MLGTSFIRASKTIGCYTVDVLIDVLVGVIWLRYAINYAALQLDKTPQIIGINITKNNSNNLPRCTTKSRCHRGKTTPRCDQNICREKITYRLYQFGTDMKDGMREILF